MFPQLLLLILACNAKERTADIRLPLTQGSWYWTEPIDSGGPIFCEGKSTRDCPIPPTNDPYLQLGCLVYGNMTLVTPFADLIQAEQISLNLVRVNNDPNRSWIQNATLYVYAATVTTGYNVYLGEFLWGQVNFPVPSVSPEVNFPVSPISPDANSYPLKHHITTTSSTSTDFSVDKMSGEESFNFTFKRPQPASIPTTLKTTTTGLKLQLVIHEIAVGIPALISIGEIIVSF